MATYEQRVINGETYTVPVGLRSDWKPGQGYNLNTTTKTPTTYETGYNPAIPGTNTRKTSTKKTTTNTRDTRDTRDTSNRVNRSALDSLTDLFKNNSNQYTSMSDSKMRSLAREYADLQVNPLLAAISSELSTSRAAKEGSLDEIAAAYANLDEDTQAGLDEARGAALSSAVSRGMGRSGVVDWQTEKRTTPILLAKEQALGEKAAKEAAIAREIAALEENASTRRAAAEEQRGQLTATQLANLQQQNFANQNSLSSSQQQLMMSLLPLFLYG